MPHQQFSVAVVGGGLIGLITAARLATLPNALSNSIALIAAATPGEDKRTTAVMMPAIDMLKEIGVWDLCQNESEALTTMRLVDGSDRLIRAPLSDFKAAELGLDAFGYNIPNAVLSSAINDVIAQSDTVTPIATQVKAAEHFSDHMDLHLENGETISTKLGVAADGRNSLMREAAGISTRRWSYPQTALVLNFAHDLPHAGVSTEFHTSTGPFTQVPLPGTKASPDRSSLVWVIQPQTASELLMHDLPYLNQLIEEKLQSCLGKVRIEAIPQAFPLSGMMADKFASNRCILVGESGHVFPPIGAQGFNLGQRDVEAFVSLAEPVLASGGDPGEAALLSRYNLARQSDIRSRSGAVDLLNRSLLTDFLPVQALRSLGLMSLANVGPLRRLMMRQGVGIPLPFAPASLLERGRAAADRW